MTGIQDDIVLRAENLRIRFRSESGIAEAVKNISFSLKKNETLGIVGESGSGKSVTTLSLLRLLQKNARIEGDILFRSPQYGVLNISQTSETHMRTLRGKEMSMIFQEPMTSLNPAYRCGEQVAEVLKIHLGMHAKEAYSKTCELFDRVKLPSPERIYRSYPHELSGGQKQRVMIAMAMCCGPSVLIADEPTTALDVTVQASVLALIKELQQLYGTSVIFISHDLALVSEIADRVLVMYRGEIAEQGESEQIFHNPRHPYTRGLIACRPQTDPKPVRLPVLSDFMSASDEAADFRPAVLSSERIAERRRVLYEQPPILEAEDLRVSYVSKKNFFGKPTKRVQAVDGVSFKLYPGETLGLAGESGCGKSTLGRALLRLVKADGGRVLFEGKNILKLSEKEFRTLRRKIQIIFQDPYSSLNPRMTIGEAIAEPVRVHRLQKGEKNVRAYVRHLLEKTGLRADMYDRYPHEFSGGQRQRICIARTLALHPKFIICDESVSALDVSVQAMVLNLLNDLKEEFGFTCIFISHDLEVVDYMSDRVMIMRGGKIIETGYPEELRRNPSEPYTKTLMSAGPGRSKNLLNL